VELPSVVDEHIPRHDVLMYEMYEAVPMDLAE